MKRMLCVAVVVMVLGIIGCRHQRPATSFAGAVTVGGRVVVVGGSSGVSGAEVNLFVADAMGSGRPVTSGATNQSGYFSLHSVEPGTYLLRVAKAGYQESNQRLEVGGGAERMVTVALYLATSGCVTTNVPRGALTKCP